jgi:Cysteine rich repeat
MARLSFAVLAVVFGFSTAALAQELTAEQRDACKADYDKYCKGTMPGGGRIIACLNKQHDQLADACKKVIDAQKK